MKTVVKRFFALMLGAGLCAGIGRAQSSSNLVVITQQPLSQVLYQSAAAQLLVGAQGAPPLSYQWANGATNVPGATNALLYFSAISTNAAGVYTVTVSNAFNSVVSSQATLTVLPLDPTNLVSIIEQPPSQVVYEGSAVSLQVGVAGTAPFSYQWFMNGTNLANQTAAGLYFTSVTTNDTGVYTVSVTNSYNGVVSLPATLTVLPLTSRKLRLAGYETPAAGRIVVPVQLAALGAENSVAFTLAFDPTVLTNAVATSPLNLANTNAVLAPTNQVVGTNTVQLSTDPSALAQGLLGLTLALPAGWQFTATTNRLIEVGFDLLPGASPFNARLGLGDSPVPIAVVDITGTNQPVNNVLLPVLLPVTNAPALDPSLGLFLQKLTLVNPYNTNLVGGGVVVLGLGNDALNYPIVVTNATFNDTNNGVFLATGAVVPGATVDFTVEFYVADRTTVPQPVYEPAATIYYPPFSILYSVRIRVENFAYEAPHPMVDFYTRTNYNYYVQYLDDLNSTNGWLTSLPVVPGTSGRVQWYDTGAPRTTPRGPIRFYRVIQYP
jgi:hypothetical protein